MIPPPARSNIHDRLTPRYAAALEFVTVVASICVGFAIALGAAYAQPSAPAFGKAGEPIHLVVGFRTYYVVTWTAVIMRDKESWRKHLPASSRVGLNVAIRGPALAAAMRDARLHIGYIGDAARYFNVIEKTIYRLAQTRELPGFKVAGTWRVQRAVIRRWIDDRKRLSVRKER